MAEQQINPVTKQILELGPPMLFFAAYLYMRDETYTIGGIDYSGFIVAAAVFVPILLASMAILWKLTGKLSRMQVFTIVMVVLFGGLTLWAILEIVLINRRDGAWVKPESAPRRNDLLLVVVGFAAYLVFAFAHRWLFGVTPFIH